MQNSDLWLREAGELNRRGFNGFGNILILKQSGGDHTFIPVEISTDIVHTLLRVPYI